jgi:hypothetical protein
MNIVPGSKWKSVRAGAPSLHGHIFEVTRVRGSKPGDLVGVIDLVGGTLGMEFFVERFSSGDFVPIDPTPTTPPADVGCAPPGSRAKFAVGDRVVMRGTVETIGVGHNSNEVRVHFDGGTNWYLQAEALHPEASQPSPTIPAPPHPDCGGGDWVSRKEHVAVKAQLAEANELMMNLRGHKMHFADVRSENDRLSSRLAEVGSDNSRLQRELDREKADNRELRNRLNRRGPL